MLGISEYTIGWVCALPCELTAARLHLEQEHPPAEYQLAPGDDNIYHFGTIGKHHIVIPTCPDGEYGTISAANVTRDMIRTFPNLKIGLMVGIAGGAPLMEQEHSVDIRLGDVVVSIPGDGQGGVQQYDYGKALQGESGLKLTGHLNSPPRAVRGVVTGLRSDFDINPHDFAYGIRETLASRSESLRTNFGRPTSDTLFKAEYIHPDNSYACERCLSDQIVERLSREQDELVKIHYGLVASGNRLIRDAIMRNRLADELGALCFEMEAAGLMNQLPCLVVRGICDYADSHKNKTWQGFASMTAAAYARKLLLRLPASSVDQQPQLGILIGINNNLESVKNQVDHIASVTDQRHEHDTRNGLAKWLNAADYASTYNQAIQSRYPGSSRWLLKDPKFLAWRASCSVILLHGITGCGKTVLSSTIIDHLRSEQRDLVAYFHFDTNDKMKKVKANHALAAILQQLLYLNDVDHGPLHRLEEECQSSSPSLERLLNCFKEMCKGHCVSVVLDVIDEANSDQDILTLIKGISSVKGVSVLLTGRSGASLTVSLIQRIETPFSIEIHGKALEEDINAYIQFEVYDPSGKFYRWRDHPDVRARLENHLVQNADGMFRWVVCQIDVLTNCFDLPTLERNLKILPRGLYPTCDFILDSIPPENKQHAVRILRFLLHSDQPMTVKEIIDILAIQPDSKPAFHDRNRLADPRETIRICASLTKVVVPIFDPYEKSWSTTRRSNSLEGNPELHLAHASVKDYLLSSRSDNRFVAELEERESRICMSLLSICYLEAIAASQQTFKHNTDIANVFPFSSFAGQCWWDLAPLLQDEQKILYRMHDFFTEQSVLHFWLRCYDPESKLGSCNRRRCCLYFAALRGLLKSSILLLEAGFSVDGEASWMSYPLQAASKEGHIEVVQLLLAAGAKVNVGPAQANNIMLAACSGHTEVVRVLLVHGATLDGDQLEHIASRGYEEILKILFEHKLIRITEPLARASLLHPAILQLFLDHSLLVDDSLLEDAVRYGPLRSTMILVNRGAVVRRDILPRCAKRPSVDMIEFLLDHGADVNAVSPGRIDFGDPPEVTALQLASEAGSLKVVKLLWRRGAKMTVEALHAAAKHDEITVMHFLIDQGIDMNAMANGTTAIQLALEAESFAAVEFLMKRNAEITETTLLRVARDRQDGVLCLILDINGASLSISNDLFVAVIANRCPCAAKRMLEIKGELDLYTINRALDAAFDTEQVEIFQMLIEPAKYDHLDIEAERQRLADLNKDIASREPQPVEYLPDDERWSVESKDENWYDALFIRRVYYPAGSESVVSSEIEHVA